MNKKIKYGIICVVGIGILLSMCFVCKKYDEKRQIESMKKGRTASGRSSEDC